MRVMAIAVICGADWDVMLTGKRVWRRRRIEISSSLLQFQEFNLPTFKLFTTASPFYSQVVANNLRQYGAMTTVLDR